MPGESDGSLSTWRTGSRPRERARSVGGLAFGAVDTERGQVTTRFAKNASHCAIAYLRTPVRSRRATSRATSSLTPQRPRALVDSAPDPHSRVPPRRVAPAIRRPGDRRQAEPLQGGLSAAERSGTPHQTRGRQEQRDQAVSRRGR